MASSTAEVIVRAKDEASTTLHDISQGFSTLKGGADDAGKGVGMLGSALSALKQHVGTIGAVTLAVTALQGAMNVLGRGAGAIKDSFIGFNAALESNRTAFTNMLGSAQQANVFLKQLSDFANKTPFTFPELTTASERMLAFGFSAQQVIPLLTAVGNQAAVMGGGAEQIDRLTLALGQMQAKGKVSGDELLQLTEAGVKVNDVFAIIAKSSGKTADQIAADAQKGKLSSQDFIAAFETYSGRFGDVMGAQSRTFSGAMSTIQDSLQSAGARAFQPFFELIRDGAVKLGDFLQTDKFQNFVDVLSAGAQKGATAIRTLFGEFQADGISGVLDAIKAKVVGFFESFAGDNARTAGSNFIVTFATGMYEAAQGVLTTVVNDIASFIGDFFIGHSPPPKGPLKEIHKGGALLMQELTAGMSEGLDGNKLSAVASDLLGTITGALSAGEGGDFDFSKLVDGIRSGTMSMDELKAASEGVDDVTRMIGQQIQDISDKQSDLKDQIDDIKYSYEDQIDPLQRQLDALKSVVDWTTKQRDLELEISQNKVEQAMAGDSTLSGLNKTLAGLEQQQRTARTAPIDRSGENQLNTLEDRLRNIRTPTARSAAPGASAADRAAIQNENAAARQRAENDRKALQNQIDGLRDKSRVEKDGDTDASRALQARIDGVKQEIDARKATYQTQLDSIKAEKDSVDLKAKGLDLERQLQELPLEKQITDLKNAEQDRIQPLQRQSDLLDRQRQTLESQKARWGEIKGEITDALQPLQEMAKLQDQQAAAAKAAETKAKAAAKGPATGGLPNAPILKLQEQPVAAPSLKGGVDTSLNEKSFNETGARIGKAITEGAVGYIKDHFGSLVGGAIGGAVGESVFGPVGALIGGLFGARIGDALEKTLGSVDWEKKFEPITHALTVFKGVVTGDWGKSITDLTIHMGGLDGAAAALGKALRDDVEPILLRVWDDLKAAAKWLADNREKIKSDLGTAWSEGVAVVKVALSTLETAIKAAGDIYTGDWDKLWFDVGITTTKGTDKNASLIDQHLGNVGATQRGAHKTWLNDWDTFWGDIWNGTDLKFDTPLAKWLTKVFGAGGSFGTAFSNLGTTVNDWFGEGGKIGQKFDEFGRTNKELFDGPKGYLTMAFGPGGYWGRAFSDLGTNVNDWFGAGGKLGTVFDAFGTAMDHIFGEGGVIGGLFSGLGSLVQKGLNAALTPVNSFMDHVTAGIRKIGEFFDVAGLKTVTWDDVTISAPAAKGGGGAAPKATGDMNFAGGPAIIGEQGRELFNRGKGWELAHAATMLHLPKGATVLPNAVTEMLLKMGVPGFAGGLLGDIGGAVTSLAGDALGIARKGADAVYDATVGKLPAFTLPGVLADVGGAVADKAKEGLLDLIKGLLPNVKNLIETVTDGLFGAPLSGIVTPGRGSWHNPVPGYRAVQGSWTHGGTHDNEAAVDWATPLGTLIKAPDSGQAYTVWNGDGATGRTGVIDHFNGWKTYYGHVRDFASGPIPQDGGVGHTGSPEEDGGAGSGAHLHFAMRLNGAYERPEDYIPGIFGLAAGGVVTKEGTYRIAEGDRPEAVIPLDKARVGGDTHIHVDVHVAGHVMSDNDLVQTVHEGLQRLDRRGALLIGKK